ncbi:MAG: thrombospondin type 3 repeat-containing protein, partial [Gammaproteobacteria bacterium]|nr:thrombospondin type 3 repeat-containing protein [Gammaproteobacteria bacterium]
MSMRLNLPLFAILVPILFSPQVNAEVTSDTIVYLNDDAAGYLLHRTLRTDNTSYDFHVEKSVQLADFYYISPNKHEWKADDEEVNTLHFNQGHFSVIYAAPFGDSLVRGEDGIYTFTSSDGEPRANGHFGIWHHPENFTHLNYTWVMPAHFEVVDHASNREGEWVQRTNTLSFYTDDVNDVTFRIRFRERDSDGDGVVDRGDRCPDTAAGVPVDPSGCPLDSDVDGVIDVLDQCPETPAVARVDAKGCELDSDADGVVDRLDLCPQTAAGLPVNTQGCELDSDGDRVVDSQDKCPNTRTGAVVDRNGCELDGDKDGVVDGLDDCPSSTPMAAVDVHGCELDADGDGVIDARDRCPSTVLGAKVDGLGCELDSDADGVLDSADKCPDTVAGAKVDA